MARRFMLIPSLNENAGQSHRDIASVPGGSATVLKEVTIAPWALRALDNAGVATLRPTTSTLCCLTLAGKVRV